ncbi:MAG: phasin family protein [Candidatus Competibacterales bacterium]|nr:phasin family protein [Candidatus Competibacterales bacterium]
MYDELFSKSFANAENLVEPMVKANKLAVSNLEKLVNFQLGAMQSYMDMGMEQLRAAAEVNSPQSLQAFWSKQVETANVLRQKMLDDTKALVDMGNGMKDEFTKLAEDNVQEFSKAAPKVSGQGSAAKKAA